MVVSGPSGVGKSRLIEVARESFDFGRAVPTTTRARRNGEVEGIDYEFVSKQVFQEGIRGNMFCAWDFALRNYYGYRRDLERRLHSGENIVIHALARMAIRMSRDLPDVFLVFMDGSSDEVLERRIGDRAYGEEEIVFRREHRREEREHAPLFDWVIKNADITASVDMADILMEIIGRFSLGRG